MKVAFVTLGCKLNQAEADTWMRDLTGMGWEVVADPAQADVTIINSCTVTQHAARKSRQAAYQAGRQGADQLVVMTGCYAEMESQQAQKIPGVALHVPNREKERLVPLLMAHMGQGEVAMPPVPYARPAAGHTRAFVKIEDGCAMRCTYCIIPMMRGAERSVPLGEVVRQVQHLVQAGYLEVLLTGVQVSSYRCENYRLADLIRAILRETDVYRLRVTSIAPWELDQDLLACWQNARLCRHLHLSLQSGSDTVLGRMKRPYKTHQFAAVMAQIRAAISDVAITTDVIVGFPGETEAEFAASQAFVAQMDFAKVHVFSYSPRPGTAAAAFAGQVDPAVRSARSAAMNGTAAALAAAFHRRFIGRELEVLWESSSTAALGGSAGPIWSGFTDNYLHVSAPAMIPLARNTLTNVRLQRADDQSVWGEICPK
ncbi:MAG: tRNA (N(6)-L-threonylcarbamoyladenosine(37)-C(2))-methylthiotransferase MtaB [Chloroflexi bacterium]|nr:tRNA (N(6)-L-threonylcarbamoyladenosine(37)-C(2))-methylthiotransferase MtaB [Chloroflexota bacterium]